MTSLTRKRPLSATNLTDSPSQSPSKRKISTPPPSYRHKPINFEAVRDSIYCDGIELRNQKGQIEELEDLLRDLDVRKPPSIRNDSLIRLAVWLKDERHQLLARGLNVLPTLFYTLWTLYRNDNADFLFNLVSSCLLFNVVWEKDNVCHITDVVPALLVSMASFSKSIEQFDSERNVQVSGRKRRRRSQLSKPLLERFPDLTILLETALDQIPHLEPVQISPHLLCSMALSTLWERVSDSMTDILEQRQKTKSAEQTGEKCLEIVSECGRQQPRRTDLADAMDVDDAEPSAEANAEANADAKVEVDETGHSRDTAVEVLLQYLLMEEVLYKCASFLYVETSVLNDEFGKTNGLSIAVQTHLRQLLSLLSQASLWCTYQKVTSKKVHVCLLHSLSTIIQHVRIGIERNDAKRLVLNGMLMGTLEILSNITALFGLNLKEETTGNLFFIWKNATAFSEVDGRDICLAILAILINCAEKSPAFRTGFGALQIGANNAVHFLVGEYRKQQIKLSKLKETFGDVLVDDNSQNLEFTQEKFLECHIALLISFLIMTPDGNVKSMQAFASRNLDMFTCLIQSLKDFHAAMGSLERGSGSRLLNSVKKAMNIVQRRHQIYAQAVALRGNGQA